jgi:hypothetical protein
MIAVSPTPTSVATAIAASAFSTLWRPGRLSTTGSRVTLPLVRTQVKRIVPPSATTSSARKLASLSMP